MSDVERNLLLSKVGFQPVLTIHRMTSFVPSTGPCRPLLHLVTMIPK
jgi:hypothetical protein